MWVLGGRATVVGALLVAGCGSSAPSEALPVACLDEPATILRALDRAPARVTLDGGVPISRCVSLAARRDAELQELGASLMRVADELHAAARASPDAALRLGYLIGAVRAGAAKTPGLAAQLARRVEQTGSLDDAPARAALRRGAALGEEGG